MKEITLNKPKEKIVGALRVSDRTYDKLNAIALKEKVSVQTVIRAILDDVIDEVTIKS